MLLILCILHCFSSAFAAVHVPINTKLWARIDKVNLIMEKAKIPDGTLASTLQEARDILYTPAFEEDYQRIRAAAFKKDFSQADSLTKRAAPSFFITFDGDYDRHEISFEHFKSRAVLQSEAAEFFSAYSSYLKEIFALGQMNYLCRIPFTNTPSSLGVQKTKPKLTLVNAWKERADKWKEPFFREFAKKAVECLSVKY